MRTEFWWETSCKMSTWKTRRRWENNSNVESREVVCEDERRMELVRNCVHWGQGWGGGGFDISDIELGVLLRQRCFYVRLFTALTHFSLNQILKLYTIILCSKYLNNLKTYLRASITDFTHSCTETAVCISSARGNRSSQMV
jgi:hypothetical protein